MTNIDRFPKLKECLDIITTKYHTPGIDCIVYQNHEQLFRYYTGMSDLEAQKRMQGDELYLIFSMTKMLTCVAALQLLERGKYTLNDPVYKYLPEYEHMKVSVVDFDMPNENFENKVLPAQNVIKIRHLFTMAAGLDYDRYDEPITEALKQGKTSTRDLVGAMSGKVLGFEPGTRYRYSLCHDVLGALVEVWSGQKLGDYMKEHIFDPLGMKTTFYGVPKAENLLSRMAVRYMFNEAGYPEKQPMEEPFLLSEEYQGGGSGLTSCTEDYAVFLDALACGGIGKNGERILSPGTVELMKTNHLNEKQLQDFYQVRPGYGYGLGVRTHINKVHSGSLSPLGEFGWDGSAGAFSMVDTANQLSLTYFQHVHRWDFRIQTEMRNALYADLML